MIRKTHNPVARMLLIAAVLVSLLNTSCVRKDLWLPNRQANIDIALYDIDLELYFGFNWRFEWYYEWPEEDPAYGPLGYTTPEDVRATIFYLNGMRGDRRSPFTKNMSLNASNRVSLIAANWYDMLFYNPGFKYIVTDPDNSEYKYYNMTTRANSDSRSYLPHSTRDNDDTEVPVNDQTYAVYNQPDELFGVFLQDMYVSEDPEDYEITKDEEGNTVYLYRINATMEPYTFIYLIQPIIKNNYMDAHDVENPDSAARIPAINGLTVTGLAQGVELFSRKDWTKAISISTEDIKPMQTHKTVKYPDGTVVEDVDVCASRVLTWGLPGIDPLEARRVLDETGVAPENKEGNWVGLNLVFRGGDVRAIRFNISEQMRQHPTGGIITVEIDAAQFDRIDIDHKSVGPSGGGFNASVDNWSNEVNSTVTI